MPFPVMMDLRPSRRLKGLLLALHLVIALAFLLSALSLPAIVVALLALLASLSWALHVEHGKAGMRLKLDDRAGIALLSDADGRTSCSQGIALPTGCVDFGWAAWLQWSVDDDLMRKNRGWYGMRRRWALMLLPDHVSRENWRQIRIWLRHYCHDGSASNER